jgi:hypothetical protein
MDTAPFRLLVGSCVRYQGQDCRVVDILEAEQALVLRCEGAPRSIQGDQFGEATRRVQPFVTVPFFDPETGELTPALRLWLRSDL